MHEILYTSFKISNMSKTFKDAKLPNHDISDSLRGSLRVVALATVYVTVAGILKPMAVAVLIPLNSAIKEAAI